MPLAAHIRPEPYRPPSAEQIERARSMYGEGFTVSRILAHCGMSLGTLYYWLDGGPRDHAGQPMVPPLARRRVVVGKRRKPLAANFVSLQARLTRAAQRQAFEIEQRLAKPAAATPERERDVRMLAMLTRTLRDLSGLGDGAAPDGADDAALAAARRRLQFADSMNEVDERLGFVRSLIDYTKNIRKLETMQNAQAAAAAQTQQDRAAQAKQDDERRIELARRIYAMIESRRAAEQEAPGGAE